MKLWIKDSLGFWLVAIFGMFYISILEGFSPYPFPMYEIGLLISILMASLWTYATYHYRNKWNNK